MTVFEAFAGTSTTKAEETVLTPHWRSWYGQSLLAADASVALIAALAAVSFAGGDPLLSLGILCWPLACAAAGAYAPSVLSLRAAEARRVAKAVVGSLSLLGLLSYVVGAPVARGAVLVSLPILVVGSLLSRWVTQHFLARRTAAGTLARRVLLVGAEGDVRRLSARLTRSRSLGTIVAGLVPDRDGEDLLLADDVPLLTGLDRVATAVQLVDADTVMVVPGCLNPVQMRELGWTLEAAGVELAILPGVTDVDAHRLSLNVIDGLPVLSVAAPRRHGMPMAVKHGLDRLLAGTLLLTVFPLLAVLVASVRLTSKGPAVFRQVRVGQDGKPFTLYKFRTMVVDAEAQRELLLAGNEADGPLFKLRQDPRITRIGRLLRKHSLDELPQLVNVVKGDMSLVGPRPPLPAEVAAYSTEVRRRLLVRPGLTGLWQVSGRSDLSWDDSVRLDLRYVDNVSLSGDAQILGRTVHIVLKGSGAY